MSRQAIVGAFTIMAIVALFGAYFVLSNFSARLSGYQIGVHFESASGLTRGALVYESGVQAGTVADLRMLPDFSIEVVMQLANWVDVPRDSEFVITAPLTGSSTVTIVPPRKRKDEVALLPRYILPVEQQPKGTNPATIQELLEAGRGQLDKFDALMTDLQHREPKLMDQLQSAISNANALATNANSALQKFSSKGIALEDTLQRSLTTASTNIVELTGELNDTIKRNGGHIDTLMASLNRTADSLAVATDQLKALATDPTVRATLMDTLHQFQIASANIAALTNDLRAAAGNPTTQAQLRDTLAHIDAASQRANSLLGALGGTSSVYGVDVGATPPPAGSSPSPSDRIVPQSPAPAVPSPIPEGKKKTSGEFHLSPAMRDRLAEVAKSLFEVQVRLSELNPQGASQPNNALMNASRGPLSDFNVVILPHGDTQLYTGVNALSAQQTWNFAVREKLAPGVLVGGGILYSRLGVLGIVSNKVFGIEGLAYDPAYGYVDAYGFAHVIKGLDAFVGERDIFHPAHRLTYGLQYRFFGGSTQGP